MNVFLMSTLILAGVLLAWSTVGAIVCGLAHRALDGLADPDDNYLVFWLFGVLWPLGLLITMYAVAYVLVGKIYRAVRGARP